MSHQYKRRAKSTYTQKHRAVSPRRGGPQRFKGVERLRLPSKKPRLDEVAVWFEDSRRDYVAAVNLSKHLDQGVHREVLRLLHDSVEKSLKAVLRSVGRDFPRGYPEHDLVDLAGLMRDRVKVPEKYAPIIDDLALIYSRTRYMEMGALPEKWHKDAYLRGYMSGAGELNSWLRVKAGLKRA
jgi:HEPN domain-containing protein